MIPDYYSGRDRDTRRWSYMAMASLPVGILSCPLLIPSVISQLRPYYHPPAAIGFMITEGWALGGMVFCTIALLRTLALKHRLKGALFAGTGLAIALFWFAVGLVLAVVLDFR